MAEAEQTLEVMPSYRACADDTKIRGEEMRPPYDDEARSWWK